MEVNKHILLNAQLQRKSKNPWEAKLWYHLRANRMLGFKFKRQMPIGKYIVDFCCHPKRLVIELDGGQHFEKENIKKDAEKARYLKQENFEVLRFQNIDIDNNLEGVLETIRVSLT
jgi:very-short-patch-repair endonuclease